MVKVQLALLLLTLSIAANEINAQKYDVQSELERLNGILGAMANQVMLQQYYLEERTRANGKTGLKVVRLRQMGTKSYHSDSHTSFGTISLHDHANNIRTIGMGEFSAVLNGIDFRTRHNDYRLYMPHRTDETYGAMEDVPFPDVPPSVSRQRTPEKQIEEMQEYFRAWRYENQTHRDYKNYFKPILCYLEGAWTNTGKDIDEPFVSDRHFVDAKDWMDLQQRARFVGYAGTKSQAENLAVLPTTIFSVNGSTPHFAQFNYRILCHPLKKYLPVDRFRVVDDLHNRVSKKRTSFEHLQNRAARFQLSPTDAPYEDSMITKGLLDDLMGEIPGANNYPCKIEDEGLDSAALDFDNKMKNACRYHRVYKIGGKDATGVNVVNRGYNDEYMFTAMTTHSKIPAMTVDKRKKVVINGKRVFPTLTQRWTWAMPLEIIYLTPLHNWNPYNIEYKGDFRDKKAEEVEDKGRNGGCSRGKEYDGTHSKLYFRTPSSFFGSIHSSNAADTSAGSKCVLDNKGESHQVRASGVYCFLPSIADLGSIRTRYPIFPLHYEGNTIWKELDALKDLVMDNQTYAKYYAKNSVEDESSKFYFRLPISKSSTPHTHIITLSRNQMSALMSGAVLQVMTSLDDGHQHSVTLEYKKVRGEVIGTDCDNKGKTCADGHNLRGLRSADESEV